MNDAVTTWRAQYDLLPPDERTALRATAAAMRLGATLTPDTVALRVPRWLAGAGLPDQLANDAFDAACKRLAH